MVAANRAWAGAERAMTGCSQMNAFMLAGRAHLSRRQTMPAMISFSWKSFGV
jgi:hypothetical protein